LRSGLQNLLRLESGLKTILKKLVLVIVLKQLFLNISKFIILQVHLCGEESAINIVERLLDPIGEHVDIRRYQRKGDLVVISTHGLESLKNIQANQIN
jgi:hypothetical protein